MAERTVGSRRRAERLLMYAAVFYGVAFVVHTGDHVRRGFSVETGQVLVLGSFTAVLQVVAIGAVLARHRLAPVVAVALGFPDAVGIAAVHLLPHWSAFSDAFPGSHGTGVTAFSWFAASLEVLGALLFGIAGLYAVSADASPVRAPGLA
jgi:hypothetical protein